jgi:hypothetical protein
MVWNGIVTIWLLIAAVIYMCWLVYSHLDRRLNLLQSDMRKALADFRQWSDEDDLFAQAVAQMRSEITFDGSEEDLKRQAREAHCQLSRVHAREKFLGTELVQDARYWQRHIDDAVTRMHEVQLAIENS